MIDSDSSEHRSQSELEILRHRVKELEAIVKDQRKELDNKLYEYKRKLEITFGSSPNPIMFTDLQGNITECNNAAVCIQGLKTKDDLIGRHLSTIVAPECRDHVLKKFLEIHQKGISKVVEISLNTNTGTKAYIDALGSLVIDIHGNPSSIIIVAKDISQQKADEEEKKKLATAIEQAGDVVVITDEQGSVCYVNPAFERVTGYARDEIYGKNLSFLKGENPCDNSYKEMWAALNCGKAWKGRLVNRRKDGTSYEEDATVSPVRDRTGKIKNFVAVKRDVTEISKLEAKLRRSQKLEAIGTLAGGIAHDFNNILYSIIGFAELALDTVDKNSRSRVCLQNIFEAGQRAGELVNQILTFSRQTERERSALTIQSILKEVVKLLRATFPATIQIHQHIDPHCSPVLGDPTQIHQIIMNLCTNALHAMKDKGGDLTIRLENIHPDSCDEYRIAGEKTRRWVRLTVSDTGFGMDSTVKERIFEPFFTTKKMGEGTGMGLAAVHGIVESMNGSIHLESTPGEGTTFTILFPSIIKEEKQLERNSVNVVLGGNEHILFIDDEEIIVELGTITLEGAGYTVSSYTSSKEALEKFQANPYQFDLLITDLTMPEMTGAEIAQAALKIRPDIPIILCTGYSETFDEMQAESIGISSYLRKPVTRGELLHEIQETLHQREKKEA